MEDGLKYPPKVKRAAASQFGAATIRVAENVEKQPGWPREPGKRLFGHGPCDTQHAIDFFSLNILSRNGMDIQAS